MRNIKLEIEYDGSGYSGWQVQNRPSGKSSASRLSTIQATIEQALKKILQDDIKLIVSGRTDAGVSSIGQVANFRTDSLIELKKLQAGLNGNLPEDIVITKAEEADLDFHSRFNAKSKLYRYSILNRSYPSAFLRNKAWFYPYPLDIKLMRGEAKTVLGKHDFRAFQASGSRIKDCIRKITKIKISRVEDLIYVDIEADGFLYNMVRNIVGTLVEIARGRFRKGSLKKIMRSRDRRLAGPTAPACGLCLIRVNY